MRAFARLCALALIVLLPTVAAAQSFPAVDGKVYAIFNRYTGLAMTVASTTNNDFLGSQLQGAPVTQQTYRSGRSSQHWFISSLSRGGPYVLRNRFSGQILEIGASSTANWAPANQWPYVSGSNQQWSIVGQSNGTWVINNLNSNKLLMPYYSYGDEGMRITQGQNGSVAAPAQQWDIYDVSTNIGVYTITNDYSGKYLTAYADDNRVAQWTSSGISAQNWSFVPTGVANEFYIQDRNTGKIIEIGGTGNTEAPGRRANLWDNVGANNQKWKITDSQSQSPQALTLSQATDGRSVQFRRNGANPGSALLVLEIGGPINELNNNYQSANQWNLVLNPGFNLNQKWHIQGAGLNRGTAGSQAAETLTRVAAPAFAALPALLCYPNPATDELFVSLPCTTTLAAVRVTDVRGATVPAYYRPYGSLDVRGLAPGLYVVSVSDGVREYRQKFVKQ